MNLKTWLETESGRQTAMARHFGVTSGAVSHWKSAGVPTKHMKAVRVFTAGAVSLEEMVPEPARVTRPFMNVASAIAEASAIYVKKIARLNQKRRGA